MRSVILAAGAGHRLRPVIGPVPKCLARVGGRTLLERQMHELRAHALEPITVVLGYQKDRITPLCGREVEIVYNRDFATTNSLYSLWLARDLLSDGFVVLNADVLFHPHLLTRLLAASAEDALLVALRQPGTRYSDEEMKVQVRGGCVVAIDQALADRCSDGENVGIAKFGAAGAALLRRELETLVAGGAVRDWLPRAFDAFCRQRPLHVVDTGRYPWIEIDFPDDYRRACLEVLPAFDARPAADPPPAAAPADTPTYGRVLHRV